ncbi:MAG: HAMP domain-containing histidine kinase [Lachnospiraceae bacterium]|nr:HAMP domain-containing histidine kinase [Lachnospiraceae bacterium]
MVKELRKKFVIVTSIMMIGLFGIFWTVNWMNTRYWEDREILSFIELLADSGVFTEERVSADSGVLNELTEDETIIAITVNTSGEIQDSKTLGNRKMSRKISEATIDAMLNADEEDYRIGQFVYTKQMLSDGNILIVAIAANLNAYYWTRVIASGLLFVAVAAALVALSFYLSRFITRPAEDALNREKRFISDASHELKTPLGAIGVNAQALELNRNDSIYVNNIISETGRMSRLIERLLTLSRLEETALVEKTRFSLSTVAEELMLTYESMAFEKGRVLDYDIENNLEINGSVDEIRQLIVILLDNAIKNSREKASIQFRCYGEGKKSILEVTNTGNGISQEDLPHIFERFYTTDQSRNSSSFGLGLAIAKEITERHGGNISVTSEPKGETTFRVIL